MMTALASASSHYSDGSEFAMSELSMLEFVRDLNGQSDNRFTVNQLPFEIETPVAQTKDRSLSPEIDLVPSYLLTPSSQLIPTASSSLFNYRTGGNFRKKLSSLGNTLFSKTPPSGIPREMRDPEKSAGDSLTQSGKDGSSAGTTKKGFVFPGRGDASARKLKKGHQEKQVISSAHNWLSIGSSIDLAKPAAGPALENLFPLSISDPFLSDEFDDYALAPDHQETVKIKTSQQNDDLKHTEQSTRKTNPPRISETVDEKLEHSASLPKEQTHDVRSTHQEVLLPEKPASKSLTTLMLVDRINGEEDTEAQDKHKQHMQNKREAQEETIEKIVESAKEDTRCEKRKEAVKPSGSTQGADWNYDENKRPEEQAEDASRLETGKSLQKKVKKKQPELSPFAPIDNSAAPIKVPRPKPPLAMINVSKTGLPKEDDRNVPQYDQKTEPARSKKSLKKAQKEEASKLASEQKALKKHAHAVKSEKTYDRAAELQFSPFVVAGLAEKTKLLESAAKTQRSIRQYKDSAKDSLGSARAKTSGSTHFSLWAKIPETLRSATHSLSPIHRLTTLFSPSDSHSQSNTASGTAAFLPRQADKSWQEKPTVQSLGDLFAKPAKTSSREQASSWSRPGEPYNFAKRENTETPKWRSRLRFGFSSAKESKVTKPKASTIEKEKKIISAERKKPKSILKSTRHQGLAADLGRGETGPIPTTARAPKKQVNAAQRKKGVSKKL